MQNENLSKQGSNGALTDVTKSLLNGVAVEKSKAEQIYEAIGEGYGFNGSREQCIEIINNILSDAYKPKCKKCNDKFWLYDEQGQRTGGCDCHY